MKLPHLPNYLLKFSFFFGLAIAFVMLYFLASPGKALAQWCETYPEGCTTANGQPGTMMCYKIEDDFGSCSIWSHCDSCIPDAPIVQTCTYLEGCNYNNLGSDSGYRSCTGTPHGNECKWDETGQVPANCNQCQPLTCTYAQGCNTPKYGPNSGQQSCTGVWHGGSCKWDESGGVAPNCGSCQLTCDDVTEHTFCDQDKIYKRTDCEELFNGRTGSFPGEMLKDCKTIEPEDAQDWSCQGGRDSAKCTKNYEVDVQMPNILIGEEVVINIRGTKSCKPPDPKNNITPRTLGGPVGTDPEDGFVDTEKFKQNCKIEYVNGSCEGAGDKPCLWKIICTPTRKDADNVRHDFKFEALNINFIDPNNPRFSQNGYNFAGISGNLCKQNKEYTVGARNCAARPYIKDPQGSTDTAVIDRYLDSTSNIAGEMTKALEPTELNDEIKRVENAEMPKIAVQTGFFGFIEETGRRLICLFRSMQIPGISERLGGEFWCATELNFYNKKTEVFTQRSKVVSAGERPPEVIPTPSQKSCFLEDLGSRDAKITEGNRKFDLINGAISTRSGTLPIGLPDEIRKGTTAIESSNSVSLKEYVIRDDLRSPDITCDQELYYIANYPKGSDGQIKPLFQNIKGWRNCTEKEQI